MELIGLGSLVLARGSGRLIGRLINGDPVAWTIVGVVAVGAAGYYGLKAYANRQNTRK